jgi:hypothetical protein
VPVRFLLDEHFRGTLWRAVGHHNRRGIDPVDVVRVGDPPDLPRGSPDPDILAWADRNGRVLVSADWGTMPGHFADHLAAGGHSSGLFLVRPRTALADVVAFLAAAAHASDPADWADTCRFIP